MTVSPVVVAAPSSRSVTSPTSPVRPGMAGASAATTRVRWYATDRASAEASMPSVSHTASPMAPSASRPSPLPPGSWATSRTRVAGAVTIETSAPQPPPALLICAAVPVSVAR